MFLFLLNIIISNSTDTPLYSQISSQIKASVMNGELKTGDSIPSMRALAKTLHVSVITVQSAYEELQRDGFIDSAVGRGSFITAENRNFIQEEQQRKVERCLSEAVSISKESNISKETLYKLIELFYDDNV